MTIVCALLSLFDMKVGVTNIMHVWTARFVRPKATATEASMFQIMRADRVLSVELILDHWHVPSSCEVFTFSFISFVLGGPVFSLADWADGTSCRLAISTDVHKLSVKKWLFNNIAFKSLCPRTWRPLQGHYQRNPCLDKWRETNVLLWRKVLIDRVAARAGQDR